MILQKKMEKSDRMVMVRDGNGGVRIWFVYVRYVILKMMESI